MFELMGMIVFISLVISFIGIICAIKASKEDSVSDDITILTMFVWFGSSLVALSILATAEEISGRL